MTISCSSSFVSMLLPFESVTFIYKRGLLYIPRFGKIPYAAVSS
jgi:hypothetical protein